MEKSPKGKGGGDERWSERERVREMERESERAREAEVASGIQSRRGITLHERSDGARGGRKL